MLICNLKFLSFARPAADCKPDNALNIYAYFCEINMPSLGDRVLRIELPAGAGTVAYADNLAVVMAAKTKEELVIKGDRALETISNWMLEHGLELAPKQLEALILKRPRNKDTYY